MESRTRRRRWMVWTCGSLAGLFVASGVVQASIDYNTDNAVYTQDFDTLPNTPLNTSLGNSPAGWINDTTTPGASQFSILGWHIFHAGSLTEGGADGHQRVRIGAGTSNTGAFMSFGPSSGATTERALGIVNSNTLTAAGGNAYWGMRLTNNTGNTLYGFTITYDGEQWRDGGNATPASETVTMQYSLTAASIQDSPNYTNVGAGDFVSPVNVNTGSGAAVDGNVAGKVSGITATVQNVAWQPGQDLWIRWIDVNAAGNDHGMAIDNVSFQASQFLPEPGSIGLLSIGGLFALRRARRSHA